MLIKKMARLLKFDGATEDDLSLINAVLSSSRRVEFEAVEIIDLILFYRTVIFVTPTSVRNGLILCLCGVSQAWHDLFCKASYALGRSCIDKLKKSIAIAQDIYVS